MSEYKVDKNVPIPEVRGLKGGKRIELLKTMDVGDSVFISDMTKMEVQNRFYNPSARLGMKVTVREVDGGIRMWRIK